MKKILFLLICSFLLIGCASISRNNTLKAISLESEIEPLPVAADLRVSDQKVIGEASGKVTQANELLREAVAKALKQDPPSIDNADVLVGMNEFTEITGNTDLKVIVTGYPAFYTNFRTVKEEDFQRFNIERLNIVKHNVKSPNPIGSPQNENQQKKSSNIYFTPKYQLPFSEGVGRTNLDLEGGLAWDNMFLGIDINFPLSFDFDHPVTTGGGLNFGGVFDVSAIQIALGASAGFWVILPDKKDYYNDYVENIYVLAPFARVRWQGIEFMYRMFPSIFNVINDQWSHQFMIGYNFKISRN